MQIFVKCLGLLGEDKSTLSILFQLLTPFPLHFESRKEKKFSLQSNHLLIFSYGEKVKNLSNFMSQFFYIFHLDSMSKFPG